MDRMTATVLIALPGLLNAIINTDAVGVSVTMTALRMTEYLYKRMLTAGNSTLYRDNWI